MEGIEYAAVARDNVILVSCLRSNEDLETVSRTVLPQIPKYNTKTAYTLQGYEFLAIVHEGIIYVCGMRPEFGRRLAFHFLESIRRKFNSGSLAYRAINAVEHELDRDFSSVLEDEMERFSQGDGDNITQLNRQVEEVKGVMKNNIEKVLERGDKIDALLDKASDLESNSNRFHTKSRTLKRKMYCKNVRMWLVIAFIVTVIIIVIILFSTNVINIHGNSVKSSVAPSSTTTSTVITPLAAKSLN